jgi:hypothetical protein
MKLQGQVDTYVSAPAGWEASLKPCVVLSSAVRRTWPRICRERAIVASGRRQQPDSTRNGPTDSNHHRPTDSTRNRPTDSNHRRPTDSTRNRPTDSNHRRGGVGGRSPPLGSERSEREGSATTPGKRPPPRSRGRRCGGPGANRTRDTRFRRAVLYPLSYEALLGRV